MKFLAFALPDAGLRAISLDKITRSKTNNDVLYADRTDVRVDGSSFLTDFSVVKAKEALKTMAISLGAELRSEIEDSLFFVWRSPTIGFPNGAYAYIERREGRTKVSFYGRALYGRRDFGANKSFIDQLAVAL